MVDARTHPAFPDVTCETLIIHGLQDDTVPIESSRTYAAARANVQLTEVDDDHQLGGSVDRIFDEAMRFFD